MNDVNLYPVVELMDIYYGYRYGWLSKLLEVSDTIVLRPEAKLGEAFRRRVSVKQYLVEGYGVPAGELGNLKIMLDHGIFVNGGDFKEIFGVYKSPWTLIELYSILKVDYGLAYDIPSRLQLETAVRIAASRLLQLPLDIKTLKAIQPSMRPYIEKVVETILAYMESGSKYRLLEGNHGVLPIVKQRIYGLIQQARSLPTLHSELYALSEASVRETIRNLKEQLRFKAACCKNEFRLVPVVQGLYEEQARECLSDIIDLLVSYDEFVVEGDKTYLYVAIGNGGRVLSSEEAKMINEIVRFGHEYVKKLNVNIRIHLLGWSSPSIAEKLEVSLIYSSDSLSARRRAVEGKVYVLDDDKIRLVNVSKIDHSSWNCSCPVCQDSTLRSFVLDPSGRRRNDARIIHNLWVIKYYISRLRQRS